MVVVEVPVGKAIRIDRRISDFSWFNINSNRRGIEIDFEDNWDNTYSWSSNTWYVMTADGLDEIDKDEPSDNKDEEELKIKQDKDGGEYRYRNKSDTIDIKIKKDDTTVNIKLNTDINVEREKEGQEDRIIESTASKKSTKSNYGRTMISVLDLIKIGTR